MHTEITRAEFKARRNHNSAPSAGLSGAANEAYGPKRPCMSAVIGIQTEITRPFHSLHVPPALHRGTSTKFIANPGLSIANARLGRSSEGQPSPDKDVLWIRPSVPRRQRAGEPEGGKGAELTSCVLSVWQVMR